jgi:membrane protein required for beta-lactamase induction
MNRHLRYTQVASLVMRGLSWINVPFLIAHLLVWIVYGIPNMLLVWLTITFACVGMGLCVVLNYAYKNMLKQCHELDCVALAIRDLSVDHPEWRTGGRIELIEAEVK